MPLLGSLLASSSYIACFSISNIPHQYHLLLQLSSSIQLRTNLVVEIEELLQWFAFRGHDESYDVHKQLRHGVAIEHDGQDSFHGLHLCVVCALFQLRL